MKKVDIIIIAGILVASLLAFVAISQFQARASSDLEVVIKHQGTVIKTIPFNRDTDEVFQYEADDERNVVTVKNGLVSMTEANCRDQICVKTGEISKVGEIIVCLPHKFTVEIVSKTQAAELDSIAE
ncbi:NusG domain II-containing protein [Fusibacter paucivorans]|uniref:NusG domain II-containing protein n=1 Tax=Fusibacter paucivorans TaxID=76009 RepID=A0ABS5PS26_9FIRM|nr:NusG domain II-containing protein [Fusibacter paucivorans]MBS7527371.1 NusG domain II-containing protein [Fusibacter paucivorans]